jgi:hypothetical protein
MANEEWSIGEGIGKVSGGSGQGKPSQFSGFDGLTWKEYTPQTQGRMAERSELRLVGATPNPNSGSGWRKYDGQSADSVVEIKESNRVYSLRVIYVDGLFRYANRQGKDALLIIKFPTYRVVCHIERA